MAKCLHLHHNKFLDVTYNKRFFQCQYFRHYIRTYSSFCRSCACYRYAFNICFNLSLCLWLSCHVKYAYVSPHSYVDCFWRFLTNIVSLCCFTQCRLLLLSKAITIWPAELQPRCFFSYPVWTCLLSVVFLHEKIISNYSYLYCHRFYWCVLSFWNS